MPDDTNIAVLDPAAGGDPQVGGTEVVQSGDGAQLRQLQAERDRLQQELEAKNRAEAEQRRKSIEQLRQSFRAKINTLPEKDRREAEIQLREWELKVEDEEREHERKRREAELSQIEQALGVAARKLYVDTKAAEHGLDPKELQRRVEKFDVTTTEGVDEIVSLMVEAKSGKVSQSKTPAIARGRTDSATATGGASRTYADIIRDYRQRQLNGEHVGLKEAREEARQLGVLPPPLGW